VAVPAKCAESTRLNAAMMFLPNRMWGCGGVNTGNRRIVPARCGCDSEAAYKRDTIAPNTVTGSFAHSPSVRCILSAHWVAVIPTVSERIVSPCVTAPARRPPALRGFVDLGVDACDRFVDVDVDGRSNDSAPGSASTKDT
jgi:hypothetical protein